MRASSPRRQVLDPAADKVGDDYFNGVAMIKKKTHYALDHMLGGVMIWESGYRIPLFILFILLILWPALDCFGLTCSTGAWYA